MGAVRGGEGRELAGKVTGEDLNPDQTTTEPRAHALPLSPHLPKSVKSRQESNDEFKKNSFQNLFAQLSWMLLKTNLIILSSIKAF